MELLVPVDIVGVLPDPEGSRHEAVSVSVGADERIGRELLDIAAIRPEINI